MITDPEGQLMRLRAAVTLLLTAATTAALAATVASPAAANCGELGIPGKPPVIIIHC